MHTKGPWRIGPRFDDTYVVIESDEAYVARTVGGNDLANARLIAAAPALLQACNDALFTIRNPEYVSKREAIATLDAILSEAIRKAKGE